VVVSSGNAARESLTPVPSSDDSQGVNSIGEYYVKSELSNVGHASRNGLGQAGKGAGTVFEWSFVWELRFSGLDPRGSRSRFSPFHARIDSSINRHSYAT
jgi:hypothetical protein